MNSLYPGSQNTPSTLHSAEATLQGKPFHVGAALQRIEAIDCVLGNDTKPIELLVAHARGFEI